MNYLEELLLIEETNSFSTGNSRLRLDDQEDDFSFANYIPATSDVDLADIIIDKASKERTLPVNKWIAYLHKEVGFLESLEQIRDRLPELYKKLKADEFAKNLMQQQMLADLGGRLEVLEELKTDDA